MVNNNQINKAQQNRKIMQKNKFEKIMNQNANELPNEIPSEI